MDEDFFVRSRQRAAERTFASLCTTIPYIGFIIPAFSFIVVTIYPHSLSLCFVTSTVHILATLNAIHVIVIIICIIRICWRVDKMAQLQYGMDVQEEIKRQLQLVFPFNYYPEWINIGLFKVGSEAYESKETWIAAMTGTPFFIVVLLMFISGHVHCYGCLWGLGLAERLCPTEWTPGQCWGHLQNFINDDSNSTTNAI